MPVLCLTAADGTAPAGGVRPRAGPVPSRPPWASAATARLFTASAADRAPAACASLGATHTNGTNGSLILTLPICVCAPRRLPTAARPFSPTRFIRRHAAVVPSLIAAAAADKRYSLGVTALSCSDLECFLPR